LRSRLSLSNPYLGLTPRHSAASVLSLFFF
jgi:hypothetical protein